MKPMMSFVFVALVFIGCHDLGIEAPSSLDKFFYTGYVGKSLIIKDRGWLSIDLSNHQQVTGTYHLEHKGEGKLAGNFNSGVLTLNLDPNYVDNNLLLTGTLQASTFEGEWMQLGFPGVTESGAFVARKQ